MKSCLAFLLSLILLMGSAGASIALRTDNGAVLSDYDGNEIVALGVYEDIVNLTSERFAAVRDGKCALMNGDGRLLTDFRYDHLLIKDGLLLAELDGKQGLLSMDGTALTEIIYEKIVPSVDGGAWAMGESGGELLLLDAQGQEKSSGMKLRSMDDASGNGLLAVMSSDSEQYAYCDLTGKIVIDAQFDAARAFQCGIAVVSLVGRLGAINEAGEMLLPAQYDYIDISANGDILTVNSEGASLWSPSGKLLFDFSGEQLSAAFAGDYATIYTGENLLVYDRNGKERLCLAADASVYAGLEGQLVISEGSWGESCVYLNGTDLCYQNLYPLGYADGKAVYAFMDVRTAKYMNNLLGEAQLSADMNSARYGIVNAKGEMLLPAVYSEIEYLADNRFLVRTETQWRMINANGSVYWRMNASEAS